MSFKVRMINSQLEFLLTSPNSKNNEKMPPIFLKNYEFIQILLSFEVENLFSDISTNDIKNTKYS